MVEESWFYSLWTPLRKGIFEPEKPVIGELAFEITGLMFKMIDLWNSLGCPEFTRTKEQILNTVGIRKLVSDDDEVLMEFALDEMLENWGYFAEHVIRLGKRCSDPVVKKFEQFVQDPSENNADWFRWAYRWVKMERKVKKMERFIDVSLQLAQDLELLGELEKTLRKMQNAGAKKAKLIEFRQRVAWQQHKVRNLREMSLWSRTFDITVRLLARSLFTILFRIKIVFGIKEGSPEKCRHARINEATCLPQSRSYSATLHSSISSDDSCALSSASFNRSASNWVTDRYQSQRNWENRSLSLSGRMPDLNTRSLIPSRSIQGCITGGRLSSISPIMSGCTPMVGGSMRMSNSQSKVEMIDADEKSRPCGSILHSKISLLSSKVKLSNARVDTVGDAALALRYANIIILIQNLVFSPRLITTTTRDHLYYMLPAAIKTLIRTKLKYDKKPSVTTDDEVALAAEWGVSLRRILDWFAPLAHNTIKWHAERNFEKQHSTASKAKVLLVQTLHYAGQAKTESAIVELLVVLSYLCRKAQ